MPSSDDHSPVFVADKGKTTPNSEEEHLCPTRDTGTFDDLFLINYEQ